MTVTSDLQAKTWSVLSERGCEATQLTHEEARRLVHRLASAGHHGLCIVSDEAAQRISVANSTYEGAQNEPLVQR